MSRLTPEETKIATDILKKLDPDELLPFDLFLETCRLTVTAITEVVPVRSNNGQTEVFLTQRSADDPNWPSMWHTPGTVVVPSDISRQNSIERILKKELASPADVGEPKFVGEVLHMVTRGKEMASVFYVEIKSEIKANGVWTNVDRLPENIVPTQVDFIKQAVDAFQKSKS